MSTTTLRKTNNKLSMLALAAIAAIAALAFTCLVLAFAAAPAQAAVSRGTTFIKSGITYKVIDLDREDRDGEVKLVKYASSRKTVRVNAVSYGGYRFDVEEIGANAFNTKRGHQVTKVTLGDNVERIGTRAFCGCTKLKTLNLRACDAIELERDWGSWHVDEAHVGNNAFAGVKAKVQCGHSDPSYRSAYKRILVSRGLSSGASIVR